MKLNLRQLEVFRAMMLSGSVSAASKVLNVSQPAVSRLIAHTEQRLQFKLFERIKGRLCPTPEAHRLFEEVAQVYQGVQRANEVADNLAANRIGQLRIASSPNMGQALMPRAVAVFCERFPGIRVVLHTLLPQAMLQGLLTQQVELGINYEPMSHPSLQALPLFDNRIVAVVPQNHPLVRKSYVKAADLIDQPFIGYSSEVPFGQFVQMVFGDPQKQPVPRCEVQQAHVACAMVQSGLGIALVDELTIQGPVWTGIVAIPVRPATHAPVSVFHQQLHPLSRPAQAFIEVLQSLRLPNASASASRP